MASPLLMVVGLLCGLRLTGAIAQTRSATAVPQLLPCRAWRQSCFSQDWVCSSEEAYQRFNAGSKRDCLVLDNSNYTGTPPGDCVVINGVCDFTESAARCRSWFHVCEYSARCGSELEYAQYVNESALAGAGGDGCSSTGGVPPLTNVCTLIDGACQWYDPCREWKDTRCSNGFMCGSHSDYWQYELDATTPCPSPDPTPSDSPPGSCVLQGEQCGWSAVTIATCPEGMEWSDCGPACPLACDNSRDSIYCPPICISGCFCPARMMEHEGTCVQPSDCPLSQCAYTECAPNHSCRVSEITGEALCEPSCALNNGGCLEGQACSIEEYECYPQPCDNYRNFRCTNPLAEECSSAQSACPGGERCLEINGDTDCLPSCFVDNGGCHGDQYCVSVPVDFSVCRFGLEPCSTIKCIDKDDVSGQCIPGKQYSDCDDECGHSCEIYVKQEVILCADLCYSGCFCPPGLVNFRERCVDPLECWSLIENPPHINLLPLPSDSVLLEFTVPGLSSGEFTNHTDQFVGSVQNVLDNEAHTRLRFVIYAVLQEEDYLFVYLMFEDVPGGLDGEQLAAVFSKGKETLSVELAGVAAVEGPTLPPTEEDGGGDGGGLSVAAIAGITVAASVIIMVVAAVSLLGLYVIKRCAMKPVGSPAVDSQPEDDHPVMYSKLQEVADLENDYVEQPHCIVVSN